MSSPSDHIAAFRRTVPSLESGSHKGQHGRVGVIGGCREYTGAPYFSAIAALRAGADLAHVFCASDAALAIKSYSPDSIVHPVLDRSNAIDYIEEWIERLHALVVGPGLGRSGDVLPILVAVIEKAKKMRIPLVFDADGLYFVNQKPSLVRGYSQAILTPNVAEFHRLYSAVIGDSDGREKSVADKSLELARQLGNVTLLVKGATDIVTNGQDIVTSSEQGSGRRCGGQGDILSGVVTTFASWGFSGDRNVPEAGKLSPTVTACLAASVLTRTCNALAFKKHGRGMLTSDMIKFIGKSFEQHFGGH